MDDFDSTKKREEDFENERELINTVLDFYKKKKTNSHEYEEDNCEFMIIFPLKNQDVEQKVEELEEEIKEGSDEEYCDYLDEFTQTSFIADEKFI